MMQNSLRTREVVFAYLFGPPQFVSRESASRAHGRVCDALGLEDLGFQYSPGRVDPTRAGEQRDFEFAMVRREGSGAYTVHVRGEGADKPLRMLLSYSFPTSLEVAIERFELTARELFETLRPSDGEIVRVVAEVRLRSQCATPSRNALAFMRSHAIGLSASTLSAFGPTLDFGSVTIESSAHPGETPLDGPKRELRIETLRNDPTSLYVEFMSQWPHVPDPSVAGIVGQEPTFRPIDPNPRGYIESARAFLTRMLETVAQSGEQDR